MFDLADLQGNILRGYTKKPHVRYLILEVADRIAARRWLAASISGRDHDVPQITTGNWGAARPDTCFNIGLTYEGLCALGTPSSSLEMFPNEFIEGMTARALKLGDVGPSAPETWPSPFDEPERIHLIATIYAEKCQATGPGPAARPRPKRPDAARHTRGIQFPGRLCSLRVSRQHHATEVRGGSRPAAPSRRTTQGAARYRVAGTSDQSGRFDVAGSSTRKSGTQRHLQRLSRAEAGRGQASRSISIRPHPICSRTRKVDEVLPPGAEEKICQVLSIAPPSRHAALREIVAANLCGRWRDGTPLALSADAPDPKVIKANFDYVGDSRCPYGAHIRRCNPRGGQIVQRIANNSRRLVRRGVPYGPPYDPAKRKS